MWYAFSPVGDEEIDRSLHRINYALSALAARGRGAFPLRLADAIDQVLEHLCIEERLVEAKRYRFDAAHRAHHRTLRRTLDSIRFKSLADPATTGAAAEKVKKILAHHVDTHDVYLVPGTEHPGG